MVQSIINTRRSTVGIGLIIVHEEKVLVDVDGCGKRGLFRGHAFFHRDYDDITLLEAHSMYASGEPEFLNP